MSHPGAVQSDKHKVVIIGSGFGGLNAAQKLRRADVDIKLIAKTTHHLFQPLLYQVATGILSEGEIAPPTRLIMRKQRNAQVVLGEATHIDLVNQTVDSVLLGHSYRTPYDSLIIAAGAGQSYFGNDQFAEWAPGMKTIDDALELRGRILGAFEQAERSSDPVRREKLLTFVVVGAGPTGVEMAGQIAELSDSTLKGAFRHIDPTQARVILIEGADQVLPPMGPKLGAKAHKRLEKLGVEIQLNAMVTDVDRNGLVVKYKDGTSKRIESATKVWSAGVAASPLGADLARQSDTEIDRAGRVKVLPDLTIPGHPNVWVVGDMAFVEGVPGQAQGAIQGAKYAADLIKAELKGASPDSRAPFKYFNKGSMAAVSKYSAVAQVGKLEFGGFLAWLAWLGLHLIYLVGFQSKLMTVLSWTRSFLSPGRGQLTMTEQQAYARTRIEQLEEIAAVENEKAG
ncbi:NAD(P)/FAD-dependent oxidoreductase [Mycolicibacterium brumae]|uniref:NADH:ubiquinone reductase (non-electrogenic) n=1 Tax=Mycolicibacterium brumae TaxID=85968 RepID=A0A2G5PDT2_9MYCO|nr:NAD(P)/FAD-dependent oxidoreductase [Mycolicibacterium brumae]MCV7192844.1 NAD(P)/FAD-dependent oxidoreductase [Mycolicibacterium brumae]PIB76488.1 NAD(P)/FAD-dependent oxidoreductase [Mycolicibacterium brumae]RWA23434.1 NADH dehydrogenase [Mycolicibacterium brumae DSM 44177]UWW08636.1 NAD(P)/FAD-dependent oxidoreductase [Mycolicibacterium brumae]